MSPALGAPNEVAVPDRNRRPIATTGGVLAALLLFASCGSADDSSTDAAPEAEPAPAVERIADPVPDCGPVPTSLVEAVDADGAGCLYTAPANLIAESAGELSVLVTSSVTCAVDVLEDDGSTSSSVLLDGPGAASARMLDVGEGVNLAGDGDGACRFQITWTPAAEEPVEEVPTATSTTTTVAPTTTSTTTTTTTTTTTKKPTPAPTTTSPVGS